LNLTDYSAQYFACELTKHCTSDSVEKFAGAVVGTQVDLKPDQTEAALFASITGEGGGSLTERFPL